MTVDCYINKFNSSTDHIFSACETLQFCMDIIPPKYHIFSMPIHTDCLDAIDSRIRRQTHSKFNYCTAHRAPYFLDNSCSFSKLPANSYQLQQMRCYLLPVHRIKYEHCEPPSEQQYQNLHYAHFLVNFIHTFQACWTFILFSCVCL